MSKHAVYLIILTQISILPFFAQTYVSVPVGDAVYRILEHAELRGLCAPLPRVKPYTRAAVLSAIGEILSAETDARFPLTEAERRILKETAAKYQKSAAGLALNRAQYYTETDKNIHLSVGINFAWETEFSNAFYFGRNTYAWGTDNWLTGRIQGDMGTHFSYGYTIAGGFLRSPRKKLGTYHTYYGEGGDNNLPENPNIQDENSSTTDVLITAYSQPLAYFPYAYHKRWEGFVYYLDNEFSNSSQEKWPQPLSAGWVTLPELGGSLLGGHITYRWGRFEREWAGMTNGASLMLNASAQPFLAMEASATPFDWLSFSTLTGILEYYPENGLKDSARTSQNAFSVSMLEFNYKNFLYIDAGSTAIWAKRFELGYLFPLTDNFLYQNNIGDFDNVALFFDVKGQYPGVANLWFSFFLDEINIADKLAIFELDRAMYAYQAGSLINIPRLPFASARLSYTKIEPYCYTHTKEFLPWYYDYAMEQAYINNGTNLGHYLPPNSDEVLLRFEAAPGAYTGVHVQYQMIRHGADFGSKAVDGSSLHSELGANRSTNPVLKKYFLRDGAYQWQHVVKFGADHTYANGNAVPFQVFGEAGVVFSYFTDINGGANQGESSEYSVVDTREYPKSTGIIATVGIRIFP
ncbi:hypothetical protein [Treponema endosymbiont of Eucomonympha sp.]|uniref:hypothetical protein n=2 Tax=Treponema endosymbiont of Eucomonympha sp. TaxID=1580831 RepID=UPI0007823730|nr:hypothetical protein [Treponema endosymbiont of Eucomonympha sp.]